MVAASRHRSVNRTAYMMFYYNEIRYLIERTVRYAAYYVMELTGLFFVALFSFHVRHDRILTVIRASLSTGHRH